MGISKEKTNVLKGVFSILIVLHHLYQYSGLITNHYAGMVFQALGYLSVSVFLFLSGYGLTASYLNNADYLKTYPKKRLLPFCLNILILIIIYTILAAFAFPDRITLITMIESFTFGGTIIQLGWYLQVALLLYVVFYLVFKLIKKDNLKIILILLICAIYAIVMYLIGYSSTWFECIFAFPLGIIFAVKPHLVTSFFEKHKFVVILISTFLFAVSIVCYLMIDNDLSILIKMFSSVFFAVVVYSIIILIPGRMVLLQWIGKYSLEIYATQGLFMWILHLDGIYGSNYAWLVLMGVVFGIALASLLLHALFGIINKLITLNKAAS